ncbi:CYTH domain protein [Paraliobacillus sp. PM-2]|uniref:CYTH domain-containing protein n=1 Tax=Paraliobacillus sp. PM-2 TaxID=1462524 RepID=UPI00061C5FA4|nr:CYTH domain-containing protein [Paraliobacillus sp. PM-2]CQR47993.1 CYTH domain protein [Paraliobacillus sp. PM-2]
MVQEIEMESKNLLTKQEYKDLIHYFNLDTEVPKKQVNYYFETPDFHLKNTGSALRIREKNGQWTLTLKQPYHEGLLETHDQLTETEAKQATNDQIIDKPNVGKQLKQLKVDRTTIQYMGSLETHRFEVPYKNGLVVIDFSKFNGYSDYELEIESSSKLTSETIMKELAEILDISIKHTPNKIERFYHTLQK